MDNGIGCRVLLASISLLAAGASGCSAGDHAQTEDDDLSALAKTPKTTAGADFTKLLPVPVTAASVHDLGPLAFSNANLVGANDVAAAHSTHLQYAGGIKDERFPTLNLPVKDGSSEPYVAFSFTADKNGVILFLDPNEDKGPSTRCRYALYTADLAAQVAIGKCTGTGFGGNHHPNVSQGILVKTGTAYKLLLWQEKFLPANWRVNVMTQPF